MSDSTPPIHVCLPDGTPMVVRPLHEGDEGSIAAGFDHLSGESRRLRFFRSTHKLPHGHVDLLVRADGVDHLAWGIAEEATGTGVGIARVIRDHTDRGIGEFAITIVDEWQRRGAGTTLARALARRSKEIGIERWLAVVLLDNRGILRLLPKVGTEISRTYNQDGSADIVLSL